MPTRKLNTLLDRHGESVTVTRYTQDGTDAYGDPSFTETAETVNALVERSGQQSVAQRSPAGERPLVDVRIYLPETVPVDSSETDDPDAEPESPERTAVAVDEASVSTPKPSRIERTATGEVYRVTTAFIEGNGLIECGCDRLA